MPGASCSGRTPTRLAQKQLVTLVELGCQSLPSNATLEVGRISSVSWWEPCECGTEDPDGHVSYCCDQCDEDGEVKKRGTAIPVTLSSPHYVSTTWYLLIED